MNLATSRAALCLAVSALIVSAVGVAGSASAGSAAESKIGGPSSVSAPDEARAAGLIVRTVKGSVTPSLRSRADGLVSASVTRTRAASGGATVLSFDRALPLAEAQAAADTLSARSDVVSVEPDIIATALLASPVPRNDPLFPQQFGVWDSRSTFDGAKLPPGGYSVRAPYLWRATSGSSSVRVAVIDTGATVHPDLAGETIGGYDFFTGTTINPDRDGTPGRDGNPSDPGDWQPTVNYCGEPEPDDPDSPTQHSSWHATHVTGIIVARANNATGVTGIAPGARVQPIRVLGPCGGSTSDIADAIVWAAGGHVPGVPDNTKPAKVINLSLGTQAPCDTAFQSAINVARSKGAVVVAAAGNGSFIEDNAINLAPMGAPANCSGVVAVVATDELGQRTSYTSVGTSPDDPVDHPRAATIAAPGGEANVGYSGILSTLNNGLTVPDLPSYRDEVGTSMAAPAVSAGAALMASLGYSRTQIETALRRAVRAFPQYSGDYAAFNCSAIRCGAGILDLATVPVPYGPLTIKGTMKKGRTLSVSKHWTGNPKAYGYIWYRSGKPIWGATKSTYKLKNADKGKKISVRVFGKKPGFKTLSKRSPSRRVHR